MSYTKAVFVCIIYNFDRRSCEKSLCLDLHWVPRDSPKQLKGVKGRRLQRLCVFNQNHASRKVIDRSRGKTRPSCQELFARLHFRLIGKIIPFSFSLPISALAQKYPGWGVGETQSTSRHFVRETHIPRDMCSGEHISLGNTYHCDSTTSDPSAGTG